MVFEEELATHKRRLREEVNARRNSLLPHVRTAKSHAIVRRLKGLAAYDQARYPLVYVAMPSEVQTLTLIDERLSAGKPVAVPKVESDGLALYEITAVTDLAPGVWGILEPQSENVRPADEQRIDVIVIPGVVFDPAGHRLGYGRGYYDRLLRRLGQGATKVALAFEIQLVRAVPSEPHDVHMDYIITEERTIECVRVRDEGL